MIAKNGRINLPGGFEEEPEEERPPEPIIWKIVRGAVAVLAIAGLLYLSGIYPLFFYRRTPPAAEEKELPSAVRAETIFIPLSIFILTSSFLADSGKGELGSERTEEDARRLVENASRIWNQAGIRLEILKITALEKSEEELSRFYHEPRNFIAGLPGFDPAKITVILIKDLNGINGIAFGGTGSLAVADYTTVFDFRTLAHEIGHILGLEHVSNDRSRLMYAGATGTSLTLEEIKEARRNAYFYVIP